MMARRERPRLLLDAALAVPVCIHVEGRQVPIVLPNLDRRCAVAAPARALVQRHERRHRGAGRGPDEGVRCNIPCRNLAR